MKTIQKLYPEDRISEFKDKLTLAIPGLPAFKQHLYTTENGPLYYRVISDMIIDVDLYRSLASNGTFLFDFPIDNNLYQTRDSVKVESSDYFVTLSELYRRWNVRHFYLISIDEFISGHEEQLAELAKNDTYQFDMIYYAAILKFRPIISLEVFQTLILKGAEIQKFMPICFHLIWQGYAGGREILGYKYRFLANPPANFLKYAPKAASLTGRKSLTSKSV